LGLSDWAKAQGMVINCHELKLVATDAVFSLGFSPNSGLAHSLSLLVTPKFWYPPWNILFVNPVFLAKPLLQIRFLFDYEIDGVYDEENSCPLQYAQGVEKTCFSNQNRQNTSDHWIATITVRAHDNKFLRGTPGSECTLSEPAEQRNSKHEHKNPQ